MSRIVNTMLRKVAFTPGAVKAAHAATKLMRGSIPKAISGSAEATSRLRDYLNAVKDSAFGGKLARSSVGDLKRMRAGLNLISVGAPKNTFAPKLSTVVNSKPLNTKAVGKLPFTPYTYSLVKGPKTGLDARVFERLAPSNSMFGNTLSSDFYGLTDKLDKTLQNFNKKNAFNRFMKK